MTIFIGIALVTILATLLFYGLLVVYQLDRLLVILEKLAKLRG